MKGIIILSVFILYFFPGCKKDNIPSISGTVTIDNSLAGDQFTGYYAFGFSFALAKKVPTNSSPPPDITIDNNGTLENLIFQANNLHESFYKAGEYPDATSAEQAFKNLISPVVSEWEALGDSVRSNQIWIYRSGNEHYSKLRVISTKSEQSDPRDFAECTFEWVYQKDGSLTFP